ncbi:MAG: PQQ-dependent sugar dehydrogenase [Holophagales bacterium]|nr:PQQ-dependent sugar dehydrogenase [Holophagales bacterium]MYG31996.1 PQQ-dependent sugar dehydrogenase [Holophagales bacterium]MYI80414.1 PQQ-dependent sugar dehydrogenase [Holophagales bacterium]
MTKLTKTRLVPLLAFLLAAAVAAQAAAQTGYGRGRSGLPRVELPDEPWIMNTHVIPEVKVSVVARGINRPWSLAFLPKGDMLITERGGALRLVRDGVLVDEPIAGVPDDVLARSLAGMMEVATHPHFADNGYVYLTYTRQVSGREGTVALVRGKLDGMSLVDVEDVFVAEPWGGSIAAARLAFVPGEDIMYMTMGGAFGADLVDGTQSFFGHAKLAQDPNSHAGKTLRLRLDGSVPDDNPFVGMEGHKPEVYSMGHRNQMGLALHPETNQPWTTEHAPQGGDELNAIEAGKNYGWPVVSYGRHYNGVRISERFWAEGMEEPAIFWLPSIAPSGLMFYTGDAFPEWKGNLFAGALMTGRMPNTGHLERLIFSEAGEELGREWLLKEVGKRIRDVRQGPDEFIYVITDETDGALMKLEPVEEETTTG